ncbi:hypothetical protein BEN47_00425 [Hymenobacter lapidarius]|uniref:Uncharacterized protein n=1 Tax=Hymenobacter lapidarius TaxID=1908237 RepID=A0A1G1T9X2_9BACT|nr:hypothetical protein BEN47_00425 [Hymenobacter lapidarius]
MLLSGTLPAFSQGRDTVFAVRKLFHQKRGSGESMQQNEDASTDQALYGQQLYGQQPERQRTAQERRSDALVNTAFMVAGMLKASAFNVENEAAIIRHYQAGGSIPPAIRRKLKRRHFHRTAKDVLNAKY